MPIVKQLNIIEKEVHKRPYAVQRLPRGRAAGINGRVNLQRLTPLQQRQQKIRLEKRRLFAEDAGRLVDRF